MFSQPHMVLSSLGAMWPEALPERGRPVRSQHQTQPADSLGQAKVPLLSCAYSGHKLTLLSPAFILVFLKWFQKIIYISYKLP